MIDTTELEKEVIGFQEKIEKTIAEMEKVVVGQKRTIRLLLATLFSGGHGLFVGVPGIGKTLIVSTLARVLDLEFNRIQFTPDLLPSDVTGTEIIEEDRVTGSKVFKFVKGPIFTNILLADEINRSPPKTQSALLQAMQEKIVTVYGKTYSVPQPFHVFATQNPIEQEGTYPLPEAQLDRFLMEIDLDYPDYGEEKEIIRTTTTREMPELQKVLSPGDILKYQKLILNLPLPEVILDFITTFVRETRPATSSVESVKKYVLYGAGPRGGQALSLASKVIALMSGRVTPSIDDVREIAVPSLKHRIILNFQGMSEGITTSDIIEEIFDSGVRKKS